MKTFSAATALLLAASLAATACSRHDDAGNQAVANDTVATDGTDNADAFDGNVASPDAPLNGVDGDANAAAPTTSNTL